MLSFVFRPGAPPLKLQVPNTERHGMPEGEIALDR
jgi:hypothetical protein